MARINYNVNILFHEISGIHIVILIHKNSSIRNLLYGVQSKVFSGPNSKLNVLNISIQARTIYKLINAVRNSNACVRSTHARF